MELSKRPEVSPANLSELGTEGMSDHLLFVLYPKKLVACKCMGPAHADDLTKIGRIQITTGHNTWKREDTYGNEGVKAQRGGLAVVIDD